MAAIAIILFLNSCDHIDAVGDKVNELKDLRQESTEGIDGMKLGQILDGIKGGPTIQALQETEFDTFISESGRLNIIEFESSDSSHSVDFQPVLAAVVDANSSVARLGRIDVEKALNLADIQEVRKVPDVRFYLDGQLVHQFTGTESEETLDKLVKLHSASVIPTDDFAAQLNKGIDGLAGDSSELRPAKVQHKASPIDEAMKPMDKEWLPPGMSRKK